MKYALPESIEKKLYLFSLLYFATVLPFQFEILSPTIGILGISVAWLFSFRFREKFNLLSKNIPALLMIALLALHVLGLAYTTNSLEGEKDVIMKMSFLVFPLTLGTLRTWPVKWTKLILQTLAISSTLSSIYLLSNSYLFHQNEGVWLFHQDFVSYPRIGVHYFALYCLLSMLSILYFFPRSFWKKVIAYMALLVLITSLFFCAARIQLIIFGISIFIYFFWKFKHFGFFKVLLFQLLTGAFLITLFFYIPFTHRRFIDSYHELKSYEGKDPEFAKYQTNHRVYLWKYGIEVIKDHLPLGTGTGSENDHLYEKLKNEDAFFWDGNGYYRLTEHKYNFHNEFLQHLASLGIAGFLLLVFTLFIPIKQDIIFPALLFIIMIVLSCLTESLLQRQAGTLFFSFFYALFFCTRKEKTV